MTVTVPTGSSAGSFVDQNVYGIMIAQRVSIEGGRQ